LTLKIKVDEDLPKAVAESIRRVIPDTLTVVDEGLSGILDPGLWDTAQGEGRFLITGDKAFANIRKYPPGTHHGVLLLRPNENGILQMLKLIDDVLKLSNLEDLSGCIAVASPGRLKVRRPKT
jgi:predicted nuclease of predicted toxin-antitoxin system